jgi:2,3,4,5-tetrahydropyridine-2,6-dicarboxylate N-succinyltransferase
MSKQKTSDSEWAPHRQTVEAAWENPSLRGEAATREAVEGIIEGLDQGRVRVASPVDQPEGEWQVHLWVKEAILLYFAQRSAKPLEVGPYHYRDKIPLKRDPERAGIRVVPPATLRYGAFLDRGVVAMPCYVNIGAHIGGGTMIDTWATVGSCAQVGRNVHISGGVGIGGVLEPPQGMPVIIEDGVFLGSRCVVVEGVRVGRAAVLGAGVILTASTPIVDARDPGGRVSKGRIPPRAVVIPGTMPRKFPAGEFGVPCALIIGERSETTDEKTSLNELLREYPLEL